MDTLAKFLTVLRVYLTEKELKVDENGDKDTPNAGHNQLTDNNGENIGHNDPGNSDSVRSTNSNEPNNGSSELCSSSIKDEPKKSIESCFEDHELIKFIDSDFEVTEVNNGCTISNDGQNEERNNGSSDPNNLNVHIKPNDQNEPDNVYNEPNDSHTIVNSLDVSNNVHNETDAHVTTNGFSEPNHDKNEDDGNAELDDNVKPKRSINCENIFTLFMGLLSVTVILTCLGIMIEGWIIGDDLQFYGAMLFVIIFWLFFWGFGLHTLLKMERIWKRLYPQELPEEQPVIIEIEEEDGEPYAD